MTHEAFSILADLARRGCVSRASEGKLVVTPGPPPDLCERIRVHKPALMELLAEADPAVVMALLVALLEGRRSTLARRVMHRWQNTLITQQHLHPAKDSKEAERVGLERQFGSLESRPVQPKKNRGTKKVKQRS